MPILFLGLVFEINLIERLLYPPKEPPPSQPHCCLKLSASLLLLSGQALLSEHHVKTAFDFNRML